MTLFSEWQPFYEIVGSAAGALTGLQFVAMVLIADLPQKPAEQGVKAFTGPTVVHFAAALLLAASVSMPSQAPAVPAILWVLGGVGGLLYSLITTVQMRRQKVYKPVFEDWLFHSCLPLLAYADLAVSGALCRGHLRGALFGIAGTALLLLVVGIHNAWDNLTFLVEMKRRRVEDNAQAPTAHP